MSVPNNKGIAPSLVSILLIAISVTIAVAVVMWVYALLPAYTGYEEISIVSYGFLPDKKIYVTVKNTGSRPVTITNVLLNKKAQEEQSGWVLSQSHINPGEEVTITIDPSKFGINHLFSGVSYEITLETSLGNKFTVVIRAS